MTPPFTVFLDRDGVFDEFHLPGVRDWDRDWHWLPGVKGAFARLNRPDVQTALCTNQPNVGHLMVTARRIHSINERLRDELARAGGRLDHIEAAFAPMWFPHRRRKPRAGMLEDAAAQFAANGHRVEKGRAVMIGDTWRDAGAAAAFGIPAICLATTHTESDLRAHLAARSLEAEIVPDLSAAVDEVLRRIDAA